ncbi:hypothetical protein AB5I41_03255 [Sphingomonas sp. MMS24-JH45]
MTDVLRDLRDYADHLCSEYDIGAVTLQVCDWSTPEHRVAQLLNLKVPDEAPHTPTRPRRSSRRIRSPTWS